MNSSVRIVNLFLLCLLAFPARAEFRVFACEPEWADLVSFVMPEARLTVATSAWQDPHYIEARPSLIAAMRNSNMAVCTGASLEAGWLPVLLQRAGNAHIAENRAGLFYAARHTHLHQPHSHVDRSMGDVHPEGNPHFHLNPEALPSIMRALVKRIKEVAPPEDSRFIDAQHLRWSIHWEEAQKQWQSILPRLQGMKVIVQHTGFEYLLQYAGIEAVLDLEPKPGLPPTASHLNSLLNNPRRHDATVIIISPYQDPQPARWLSEKSGIPVIILPTTVTEQAPTNTLTGLISHLLHELAQYMPSVSDKTDAQ